MLFNATRVYKPGSVLTAIYLDLQLLAGSSHLLEAVGQTYCFSTALLRIEFTSLGAHFEILFHESADLFHHHSSLKALKYIQYSGGFQCLC